jgi:competence protein ComEA
LVSLKGIGPKTAKKIVEYRNKHGLFSKVEDLIKIKGIGAVKLKTLKPFLVLESKVSNLENNSPSSSIGK